MAIWEENQIIETKVFFNPEGLAIEDHVIYRYDQMANDNYVRNLNSKMYVQCGIRIW